MDDGPATLPNAEAPDGPKAGGESPPGPNAAGVADTSSSAQVRSATLSVRDIKKHYGGVDALRGVSLDVFPGEVLGLVGENGAGKSTLIKVISGAETPDEGTVSIEGQSINAGSPADALTAGISTVYQEPQLFGELALAENIFLGDEIMSSGRIDWKEQRRRVRALLLDIGLDPGMADRRVADLSIAQRQLVAVAKSLERHPKLLILDEPSAILSGQEIAILFSAIRRLRDRGVGVIYISHRLDELKEITDRVTVMRDGKIINTTPTEGVTVREVAEMMVGAAANETLSRARRVRGARVLELDNLTRRGHFRNVSLSIHAGEVVALYGLVGCGASDIVRTIYAIDRAHSGSIKVRGRTVKPRNARDARAEGFTMVPANRKDDGVFGASSISFNISIAHLSLFRRARLFIDRREERRLANQAVRRYAIKTPGISHRISNLSGGNQQKVVWARQTMAEGSVALLEEPTQGVDIGAKTEIHRLLLELADEGRAVLLVSSDLAEVRAVADRILIVRSGALVAEMSPDAPQSAILARAAGDITESSETDVKAVCQ